MAGILGGHSFQFLFQQDKGDLDRRSWWLGAGAIALPLAAMTFLWTQVAAIPQRMAAPGKPMIDGWTMVAYGYLLLFALAILLAAVSYYNLSAKRLRSCGWAPALAGLLPMVALLAGATHWMVPRVGDSLPFWTAAAMDVIAVAVLAWNIATMGISGKDRV